MLERLRKRADFKRISGRRCSIATPGLVLQVAPSADLSVIRIGFTASRRVGNSVQRNRARRRLKALVHEIFEAEILKQDACRFDYVLIARQATLRRDYVLLKQDLIKAVSKIILKAKHI